MSPDALCLNLERWWHWYERSWAVPPGEEVYCNVLTCVCVCVYIYIYIYIYIHVCIYVYTYIYIYVYMYYIYIYSYPCPCLRESVNYALSAEGRRMYEVCNSYLAGAWM